MESPYVGQHSHRKEGKISRGWRLTQVAWALIRSDRTMLVLALAGISSATVAAFFVFLFGGYFSAGHHSGGQLGLVMLIALYPSTLLSVYFNVALACAASAAFDGEQMSTKEAMRIAWGKRRQIALWSLLTALVGTILAEIANRLPGGGRIVAWLFGAAWGLATIFVVPILAMESSGPIDAVRRSGGLVKRRWGEGITGGISIGAWSIVAMIPLAIVLGVGAAFLGRHPATGVVLIAASLIGLCAVTVAVAATRQVFAVALYRYAIDAPIGGFATSDLEYPFTYDPARGKRKSWILRIGVPILGLFVLLGVIAAMVGPRHHTATEGYFHLDYAAREAPTFSRGAPVIFQRRQIGVVLGSQLEGPSVRISFQVDPSFRSIVETEPAYVERSSGYRYLQIGGRPPPSAGPPGPV